MRVGAVKVGAGPIPQVGRPEVSRETGGQGETVDGPGVAGRRVRLRLARSRGGGWAL